MKKCLQIVLLALVFAAPSAFASVFLPNESEETITVSVHYELHWHFEFYDPWGTLYWDFDTDDSGDVSFDVPPGGIQLDDNSASGSDPTYDQYENYTGYRSYSVTVTWS